MQTSQEITFYIKDLDCPDCARALQTGVAEMDGVQSCRLNFATAKMVVQSSQSKEAVLERIHQLGHDVDMQSVPAAPMQVRGGFIAFLWKELETRLALIGLILILPGMILEEIFSVSHPVITVFSLIALVIAGYPIALSAYRSVRYSHEININVLMSIAAIGAVIIGETTEGGMVMVLFAIGEALEGYTTERARQSIRSLMSIVPEEATLLSEDGLELRVHVNRLKIGDRIMVKPGERFPMDGKVFSGESHVNQAPITGESRLVEKTSGAVVFASSINGEGSLVVTVTQLSENNTISRLIKMVEEAQEKRAPAQRFIDGFARYYTPAVVVLAVLTIIIPPLLFNQPFFNLPSGETGWLYRGLALLVISCPCALVISTPVTIISAISAAARYGLLIKGGAYLEQLNQIKAVAFDKTGTLTEGKPSVVSVITYTNWESSDENSSLCRDTSINGGESAPNEVCSDLIALAHAVERYSEHPIAHAILQEANLRGVAEKYPPAESVTAIPGNGVHGVVSGYSVLVGSHKYFEKEVPHSQKYCAIADEEAGRGCTPLMVAVNGKYIGIISIADTPRPNLNATMHALRKTGVRQLIMLTGDNPFAAGQVAETAGMNEIHAELLPAEKVSIMQTLLGKYGKVAMIGDGINDSPVLASSTVGIAIGGAGGSAQAMETGDITLMNGDLTHVPFLFKLSRSAMRTIYANISMALGFKLLILLLVIFGSGTMWMAVLADVGISLVVTLNGMRLLRYKPQ